MDQKRFLEESRGILSELAAALSFGNPKVYTRLEQMYHLLVSSLTSGEGIAFNSGFSALSYMGTRYSLDGSLMFRLHIFRKFLGKDQKDSAAEDWKSGLYAIASVVAQIDGQPIPAEILQFEVPLNRFSDDHQRGMQYVARERVLFSGKKSEKGWYVIRTEIDSNAAFINLEDSVFEKGLYTLADLGVANVTLLLREIRIDEQGVLHPTIVIIEPDFIMDVTAVASCVQPQGNFPAIYALKKFLPRKTTKYIMAGHVANFFLDRLMEDPSLNYTELIRSSFSIDPVGFCSLADEDIQYIAAEAMGYYKNISRLIRNNFLASGKELRHFSVEPSFYSPGNGLQGRLDLLYRHPESGKSEIFELKSGSTFRPNAYGINPSHYAQTMLYYLILKDIYPKNEVISAFIIYAKDSGRPLRYAPSVRSFQHKTLALRNALYLLELKLQTIDQIETKDLENYLGIAELKNMSGFTGNDAKAFSERWKKLKETERRYILKFMAFVSREFRNSKTNHGGEAESRNGLSALWLDQLAAKEERFAVYSQLKLIEDLSCDSNPRMVFSIEKSPQKLANFRVGDVVVLYTDDHKTRHSPFTQIYRGTLIGLDNRTISIRLRSKLSDSERPDVSAKWTLEPDVLESGFRHYFQSLTAFMQAPPEKRSLWMGLRSPSVPNSQSDVAFPGLTRGQNRVVNKIIDSEDYFLLWGPPGTGKTSVMIKTLIEFLVGRQKENVLLLAYTNRAVDEICDAIKNLGPEFVLRSVRIGSRYSTAPEHGDLLLENFMPDLKDRRQIMEFLKSRNIFVSTVSSFFGKWELQNLIEFDRVIVDEASQILEPYLVGLLAQFKRAVLIGDHCQLPAIVTQDRRFCKVEDETLRETGLHSLSDSLFERLFLLAQKNKWDHAFDSLTSQGRMHAEISDFVSERFYNRELKCLRGEFEEAARLHSPLNQFYPVAGASLEQSGFLEHRMLFIDHPASGKPDKTNAAEAKSAVDLIALFFSHKDPLHDRQIGVICPYKAQIALISNLLEKAHAQYAELVTIDTVERYQGGARDVIVLSLCTNHPSQLNTLVQTNRFGLDRKLNVALTRAREQIIVLGNSEILRENRNYNAVLDAAEWITISS